MELELSRVDYTIVGVTTSNCLKLLPASVPKESQKVAVADSDGILQIFSIKKEDVQVHFKTLPGAKITSLQLGGAVGGISDKVFIASENEVRGYTKKGKLFLTFDSGMTETITSMYVLGNDLFLCGKHVYNHYRDCKEVGSYLCGDKIVDVIAFYADKTRRLMSLIACEGRMIRALEHARVTLSMEVENAPTLLHMLEEEGHKSVLFGTADGRVGVLDIDRTHGFDRWLIDNSKNSSTISCMASYDMSGNGAKNLIVGRQDGSIEVYVINMADKMDASILIHLHNCNESVTSIQCGVIGNQGYDEILVATYTGRIFGLTTETIDKNVGDSSVGGYIFSQETSLKISRLKGEIEELQLKVVREREKYQTSTQSFFDELSAIPLLEVKDNFVLSKEAATYILAMEVPTAIDNILLQSNVPVDLLDVEKNSAVVSYSESNLAAPGNFLLATYRCQMNTNRLEIKIRTTEGQHGTLQVYVTPLVQPKCSRLRQYDIKPLSLHYRVHSFDENRPFNKLSLKGPFSLAEIHTWVSQCLPEVPEKPQLGDNTVLYFQSTFSGTALECRYLKGEASFRTDNVSTLSILKEFLTKEATKKKVKIEISSSVNDESISHVLTLLEPSLIRQKELNKKMALLNALSELEVNDEETLLQLSSRYRELLLGEKEVRKEFQEQSGQLVRIYGVISDLYTDYYKFKGSNVKSKLPTLRSILDSEDYSFDKLAEFFRPELATENDNS